MAKKNPKHFAPPQYTHIYNIIPSENQRRNTQTISMNKTFTHTPYDDDD